MQPGCCTACIISPNVHELSILTIWSNCGFRLVTRVNYHFAELLGGSVFSAMHGLKI